MTVCGVSESHMTLCGVSESHMTVCGVLESDMTVCDVSESDMTVCGVSESQHKYAVNGYLQEWKSWRGENKEAVAELFRCLRQCKRDDIVYEICNGLRHDVGMSACTTTVHLDLLFVGYPLSPLPLLTPLFLSLFVLRWPSLVTGR